MIITPLTVTDGYKKKCLHYNWPLLSRILECIRCDKDWTNCMRMITQVTPPTLVKMSDHTRDPTHTDADERLHRYDDPHW